MTNTTCPKFSKEDEEGRNCAKDNHCSSLDGMFLCEAGICWNITDAFSCHWDPDDAEPPLNCLAGLMAWPALALQFVQYLALVAL